MGSPEDRPGAAGAPRGGGRGSWRDPLPPLVSAALEEDADSLLARLRRLAAHSSARERYAVLGEIGRGGMGRVLRVWDEDLQRELAMKEISLAELDEGSAEARARRSRAVARFIDEARITGQLHHPGIVPVHEIGVGPEGSLYFTMPLVRGRSLQEIFELAREQREGWTLHRALGVVLEVVLAVAYAHSRDVLHRDLKPTNVMVGPFGETYVMDWGLALLLGRCEGNAVVGTPAYMAPEQARGEAERVGPRSDVYSLGAILYELLAGRVPHATTLAEDASAHRAADLAGRAPRPLSEIDPGLPPELVAICEKAMTEDPAARYASALELARDLRDWLEDRVVHAYDTGTWQRLKKWRRRNRGLALALEALFVLGAASVGAVLFLQGSKIEAIAAEREAAEHKSYAASLRAADLAFELGTPDEPRRFLAACPPALRGWAWRHLAFRADSSLSTLEGHGQSVRAVEVHPTGALVATGSDDGSVRLWSLDGAAAGVLRAGPDEDSGVEALAWGPGGERLAAGRVGGVLELWDVRSRARLDRWQAHPERVTALAWSPDGARLASGGAEGTVLLWDPRGLARAPVVLARPPDSGTCWILALAWDPHRPRLAAASSDGRLELLDARDGERLAARRWGSTLYDVAFRPDGARLALATLDEGVQILDPDDLETLGELPGGGHTVHTVAYAPDGGRLLSGSSEGSLRLWDPETERCEAVFFGHEGTVRGTAWHPDGVRFVSGAEDRTVRVWSTASHAVSSFVSEAPAQFLPPRVRSDGSLAALLHASGAVHLHDPASGALLAAIPTGGACTALAFPPEPDTVAVARADVVEVFGVSGAGVLERISAAGVAQELGFAPGAERLFVRGADEVLRLLDRASGALVASWPDADNVGCGRAFDPEGAVLAVGTGEGTVRLHDAADGRLLDELAAGERVLALAWSPEGDALAAAGAEEVLLQDVDGRGPRRVLAGHKSGVTAIAFSPEGSRIATASYDRTVRVWERSTGELLLTLPGEGFYVDVAFDAEEDALVAALASNRVRVWRTRLPAAAR